MVNPADLTRSDMEDGRKKYCCASISRKPDGDIAQAMICGDVHRLTPMIFGLTSCVECLDQPLQSSVDNDPPPSSSSSSFAGGACSGLPVGVAAVVAASFLCFLASSSSSSSPSS